MNRKSIVKVLNNTKDIVAKVVGGVTTLAIKDPTGISGGVIENVTTTIISSIANELDQSRLSDLEVMRVSEVMGISMKKISDNLQDGKKLREDSFFTNSEENSSDGEVVFEGIIVSAQREYEGRKLKYYGNLLANLGFREDVSRPEAIQLIQLAERLSYRQYIILSVVGQSHFMKAYNSNMEFLKKTAFATNPNGNFVGYDEISVYQDIFEMYRIGIINGGGNIFLELGHIIPSRLNLQGVGVRLFELMELDKLQDSIEDYLVVLRILKSDKLNIANS